ncbi:MAG: cytochrome C [Nitrospinae bacterium CG11_big_fil_rev_8_21_14_0_20_56_8]|nr:MAG: cytochrome C [Nitrospinae bacterium CG11_big_fil_rev_8_21_14_0_20_56_8]
MNKGLLSFVLAVGGLAAFHIGLFPVFTPKEIGWVFNRYVYYLLFAFYLVFIHVGLRLKPPMALRALYVWGMGFYFYESILYPPVPWTLFITYMTMWSIGTFLYISQDPLTFREFRAPIVKVIVGDYKLARMVIFVALPFLVGFGTYKALYPHFEEPVELRTVHPAPPATTRVHGKNYTLEGLNNPFRTDEQDNYKDSFPFLDADKQEYMKSVTEGGTIFFQNCHFCHGDQLNGLGMFSHVFNPTPANFIDPGTIAMLRESFLFWRVSKGGPGLPNESTPWSSAMPPWEEHLKTEEIWKVILFEYWYTGWHPRTFDTESSAGKE